MIGSPMNAELAAAIERDIAAVNLDQPALQPAVPPTFRVSPLDKHAHLRRAVADLYADQQRSDEVLRVFQGVLQKHADLHSVQANAREDLRRMLERQIDNAFSTLNIGISSETAVLHRGFLGRLRWLLTGK
jgi:hypothetical protein